MLSNPLFVFICKVFFWLPICYWGWYSLAEFTTLLVVNITEPCLLFFFPKLIASIDQVGYLVEVVANVTVAAQNVPSGSVAELPIPVNPLIYSYGLPLALALILASPFNFVSTLRNILISLLVFLLIQVWGISFEATKVLFLQTPVELIGNTHLSSWQVDIIALGYQLGVLILPAVTPVVIWALSYREFIVRLIPTLPDKNQAPNGNGL